MFTVFNEPVHNRVRNYPFFGSIRLTSETVQRVALMVPVLYVLVLIGLAFKSSSGRQSILSVGRGSDIDSSGSNLTNFGGMQGESSRVEIQEFRRVQMRNGKLIWEIKGKDAHYYPGAEITHVNNAELILNRKDGSEVDIQSQTARLELEKSSPTGALLEGTVHISTEDGLKIDAESAEYKVLERKAVVHDTARISGEGFSVVGQELVYDLETGVASLAKGVRSEFNQGGKVPEVAKNVR